MSIRLRQRSCEILYNQQSLPRSNYGASTIHIET